MRKPYYKKSRRRWYVTEPGTRREINLGAEEKEAFRKWRRMIDAGSPLTVDCSYAKLADTYLAEEYQEKLRWQLDAKRIAKFASHVGLKPAMQLTRRDLLGWLDSQSWAQATKKDASYAVQKVLNWGVRSGHLPYNPLAKVKVAAGKPRNQIIQVDEFRKLYEHANPAFRLYLLGCSTGARPRQVREVEAADVVPDCSAWIFWDHKTGRTGRPLVVYLPPCVQTVTRILMTRHPSGPLFLNSRGNPWKKDTVVHNFARLRERLGLSSSVINYAQRHTAATNLLLQGESLAVVAELLGHTDTRMVSRVYGHLDQHREHLQRAAINTAYAATKRTTSPS